MCSPNTKIHLVMNAVVNVSVDANVLKMSLFRRFWGAIEAFLFKFSLCLLMRS